LSIYIHDLGGSPASRERYPPVRRATT